VRQQSFAGSARALKGRLLRPCRARQGLVSGQPERLRDHPRVAGGNHLIHVTPAHQVRRHPRSEHLDHRKGGWTVSNIVPLLDRNRALASDPDAPHASAATHTDTLDDDLLAAVRS
jgi:hypothetical protein